MTHTPEHFAGVTTHARRGPIKNSFRYGVDFVLIDPETTSPGPALFSRNRFNLASVHDRHHGGPLAAGRGAAWAREVFSGHGISQADTQLLLLTQPSYLGYVFNPVSFWLAMRGQDLCGVIAEVSTPFGDRHSYFCHLPNNAPITKDRQITAPKALHVSPFQDVSGRYEFNFDVKADRIAIRILHRDGTEGVIATLTGKRAPLTNIALIKGSLRRPMGTLRTISLIYWQAIKLKAKGARYRSRPEPPKSEVT